MKALEEMRRSYEPKTQLFTEREMNHLMFLRWLWTMGRIEP